MSPSTSVSESDGNTTGLRQSLRHAWLLSRTEFRRSYRRMADNPRQLIGIALMGLFFLPMSIVTVGAAHRFGTAVGTDAFVEQLSFARMAVTAVTAFVAAMATLMTVQEYGKLEQPEAVLTAIPYHEAVLGLLLSYYITFTGLAALPVLTVAIAFGIGAGAPASIPVIAVVLLGMMAFS